MQKYLVASGLDGATVVGKKTSFGMSSIQAVKSAWKVLILRKSLQKKNHEANHLIKQLSQVFYFTHSPTCLVFRQVEFYYFIAFKKAITLICL